jgi:hypothetical protein
MAFDYAGMAATADELLKEFGAAAQVKTPGSASYDPATGVASSIYTSQDCTACVIEYKKSEIDGTLIQAGDRKALLSPIGITEPKPGCLIVWGGKDLRVITTSVVAPAGLAVLYECQVRG